LEANTAEQQLNRIVNAGASQDTPAVHVFSQIIEELKSRAPADSDSFNRLFIAYTNLGDLQASIKKYKEAEGDYDAARAWADRLDPSSQTRNFDRFIMLERKGNLSRNRAMETSDPRARGSLLRAAIAFHEQSRDQYLQVAGAYPGPYLAIEEYNIGYDYYNLGDLKNAKAHYLEQIAHYRRAARPDPDEDAARKLASAYRELADVEFRLENYSEARSATDLRIMALKPFGSAPNATPDQRSRLAEAYGARSWHDLFVGDYRAAIADSDRGVSLNQDAVWILTNKAHAYLFLGQITLARKMYLANKDKPDLPGSTRTFRDAVLGDFEQFKKHPKMNLPRLADIGTLLERPRSFIVAP
jgi:tetratricopeptide (TPR) repeat protein